MAVRIEKSFEVNEPVEKVWAFLSDPRQVVTCVPGAQITGQSDERHYTGAIRVKVGPSTTDYKGEIEILRLDAQAHEIEILGKGTDVRGKGSASMRMTGKVSATAGGSEVVSVSELNVVGILAQMGARVIQEVSNIMFDQFMANFRRKLQEGPGQAGEESAEAAGPKPVSAVSVAFSALKAVVTGRGEKSDSEKAGDDAAEGENRKQSGG
jgi:uncharacterized protein